MMRDNTLVHPTLMAARARTDRWWGEREKCMTCAHVMRGKNGDIKCAALTGMGPGGKANCIDARDGGCGPDAKLWVAS